MAEPSKGRARGEGKPANDGSRPASPGMPVFKRGDHVELAEHVLRRLQRPHAPSGGPVVPLEPPRPVTYDVGRHWGYDPGTGIWSAIPDEAIEHAVTGFAGAPLARDEDDGMVLVNASTVKGVRHVLRNRLLSEPGRVEFSAAPSGMAFTNGFVTVQGGKVSVLPHSPMHLARFRYEFSYQDGAPCPRLLAFLEQLFADVDAVERAARIALFRQFLGACLVGDATRYQRYLVMFATGGNGKSELLRIARACFPPGTVTSIEPQKWRDDKYVASLDGVRANFVDELPDDEIMGSQNVKRIITGEPITARAVYSHPITVVPRAGHMMATNVPIQTSDHSDGFWERPAVLNLTRKFRNSTERELEAARPIIAAELPAIIGWAIGGAAEAQRQGGYTVPASSAATLLEWRDDNDQVRGFANDTPIRGRWNASTLYEEYKEWAKKNGCALMSSTKFGRRIVANELARKGRDAQGRFYVPWNQTAEDEDAGKEQAG